VSAKSRNADGDELTTVDQLVNNSPLVGLTPPKPVSEAASGEVINPDDELEKLRSNLLHAHDKRKPLTRRIIEVVKARAPRKTREHEAKKMEDAA
jgi:hypothetical protein